jgi:ribosomal protein S27AE
MQHEAARPKGDRAPGDLPTAVPMRATRQGEIRRNPSSDQKKVRRANQRRVAVYGDENDGWARATYPEQYGHNPDDDVYGYCNHCYSDEHTTTTHGEHAWEYGSDAMRSRPDEFSSRSNSPRCQATAIGYDCRGHEGHPGPHIGMDNTRWTEHDASRRKAVMNETSAKTATVQETEAWKLNPGDNIRMPNGKTMKVHRIRPHETSSKHVYVHTDGGTSVSERNSKFQVMPVNNQQQSLPGYGTPGGNTNRQPFDPLTNNEHSKNQHGDNAAKGGNNCPSCGGKGTMQRQGDHYVCTRCGYKQTYGGAGGHNFSDSPRQFQVGSSYNTVNTSGMSAIARRAQEVLAMEENK